MKHKRFLRITIILLGSVFLFSLSAIAQDNISGYPLRKININLAGSYGGAYEWVITGENTSVLFGVDFDINDLEEDLVSIPLNHKGKPLDTTTILAGALTGPSSPDQPPPGVRVGIQDVSAVWLGNRGLIFVIYLTSRYDSASLAVASFDKDGKLIGAFRKIAAITSANKNIHILWPSVAASKGLDGVIGVVYSISYFEASKALIGWRSCQTFFFETDSNGNQVGRTTQLKIPKLGEYSLITFYRPGWNGSTWLLPASWIRYKRRPGGYGWDISKPLSTELVIFRVSRPSSPKFILRMNKLFKDKKSKGYFTYKSVCFLKNSNGGGQTASHSIKKGVPLSFFYQHYEEIPQSQQKADPYRYTYAIQKIDKKGKKSGGITQIYIPEWVHKVTYKQPANFMFYADRVSHPVLYQDGQYLITQSRSLWVRDDSSPIDQAKNVYEQQLNLYSFNPDDGQVLPLFKSDLKEKHKEGKHPFLRRHNNFYFAVNQFLGSKDWMNYFSRFD